MKPEEWYIASQDNFFGPLRRRPHVAVVNNTNILNDTTVLTLRYGFSTWQDSCDKQPFSAGIGSLGFSPTYVNALSQKDVFPELQLRRRRRTSAAGARFPIGGTAPTRINGTLSKLWGNHSLKVGADTAEAGRATGDATRSMGGIVHLRPPVHEQQRRRRPRAGQRAARRAGIGLGARTTTARSSGSPSTTAPISRTTGA